MKVCHVTNKHEPKDIRIYHKECVSLAEAGHEVWLVEKGDSEDSLGVHIVGCGQAPKSRRKRMTAFARSVYGFAVKLDCELYHLHDPELLPCGMRLKRAGKKVVFDSHEDVPAQILDKHWIPKPLRKAVAVAYRAYETHVVKHIDAVVAATPHIAEQFQGRARKVVVVNNYPKLDDIEFHDTPFEDRDAIVCYAGGINQLRGEKVMIEAMEGVQGTLVIAGDHEIAEYSGVEFVGKLDRGGVNDLYSRGRAGIVIYQPAGNHYESQPIKLFEFMAAGLPVVASNFPLWKSLVDGNKCGICVDPTNATAVRSALTELLENPAMGQQMGRNGRRAIESGLNWGYEAKALVSLYDYLEAAN